PVAQVAAEAVAENAAVRVGRAARGNESTALEEERARGVAGADRAVDRGAVALSVRGAAHVAWIAADREALRAEDALISLAHSVLVAGRTGRAAAAADAVVAGHPGARAVQAEAGVVGAAAVHAGLAAGASRTAAADAASAGGIAGLTARAEHVLAVGLAH